MDRLDMQNRPQMIYSCDGQGHRLNLILAKMGTKEDVEGLRTESRTGRTELSAEMLEGFSAHRRRGSTDLTDGDLEKFGVSFGHRKRLLKVIASLGLRESAVKPAAPVALQTSTDAAERRQLTVIFCDLVGSTALSSRQDMRQIIRSYQSASRRRPPRFPAPHAPPARRRLHGRVGSRSRREYRQGSSQEQAVGGDTPNRAARLQGLAEPGSAKPLTA
jgi:hypothetical protein